MVSRLDQIYRSILLSKFFVRGWGKPENLKKLFAFRKILSNRETCLKLVDKNHPITIVKKVENGDHLLWEGEFTSPFVDHLPGLLPEESQTARFQMVLPKKWPTKLKPTCLHLAGTGDHGFWRRRMLMGKPLLDEAGIASIMLENPFYGSRKPKNQKRSALNNVSDLFVMGGCLVLESLAIFHWCEREGFGPLGITGISMGGHVASLAATSWPKPLPLVPCLSWSTASGAFTQGVLSGAINWEMLKNQYFSNKVFREELFNMITSPEGSPFCIRHFPIYHEVGQKFAREFPSSLDYVQQLKERNGLNTMHNPRERHIIEGQTPIFNTVKCRDANSSHNSENTMGKNIIRKFGSRTSNLAFNSLRKSVSKKSKSQIQSTNEASPSGLLIKYQKSKSNVQSKKEQLIPTGIRPQSAADTKPVMFEPYMKVKDTLTWETLNFMRGVMDECTHLGNFSVPVDPELVIIVAADADAYMPRDDIMPLTQIWPGCEMRMLNTGHISGYLFNHHQFRRAIADSFERLIEKHYS
ncbi:unnamed protein product, partial [Meganyctiphanes norvegica]